MGCNQGEQPALRKVGVGPALMIRSASPTLPPRRRRRMLRKRMRTQPSSVAKVNLWLC